MILLDSNIFIYAAMPEHTRLRYILHDHRVATSIIVRVEVLGYHRLAVEKKILLTQLLGMTEVIPLSFSVAERAIQLRQQRRMTLGDSLVAATALLSDLPLWTHNVRDFLWIDGLVVHDPILATENGEKTP